MKKIIEKYKGIEYIRPKTVILADNGIAHSEFAGRTCYDSFDNSEHECVKELNELIQKDGTEDDNLRIKNIINNELGDVCDSELLKQLSFVHFHHSVLEHSVVTFFIKGISRAVLQELARHRIASFSVKSTRYTLDMIMYYFIISKYIISDNSSKDYFVNNVLLQDIFTINDETLNRIELKSIYDKLDYHTDELGREDTLSLIIPKSNIEKFLNSSNHEEALEILLEKKKRNVGDAFKSIVVFESMSVDLTLTMNLRSLKNFFDLRLSGAAWFQIQWLAEELKEKLPNKYKRMIFKSKSNN